MITYFSSSVGQMNKCRSDINLLVVLIENKFKPVRLKLIRHKKQLIKYELTSSTQIDLQAGEGKNTIISPPPQFDSDVVLKVALGRHGRDGHM